MDTFLHDLSWVVPLRSGFLTPIFEGFTYLGYTPFFLFFLPLGYWLWNKDMFTRLTVVVTMTAIVNAFLKDLLQDPRPDLIYALDGRVGDSYGLPSGHAQIATVMWLWLAYEIGKRWAWLTAIFVVAGVSFSRIYLGVHDVEDVLGGVILGLINLYVFRVFVSERFERWHALHPAGQIFVILAAQPLLWWLWPAEDGPGSTLALGAFLTGWWLGVIWDRYRFDFRKHPQWWGALIAGVAGAAGLIALRDGTSQAIETLGIEDNAGLYAQTLILAIYMTMAAPLAFSLARLGRSGLSRP